MIWFFLLCAFGSVPRQQCHWWGREGCDNPTQSENLEEQLRADQEQKLSAGLRCLRDEYTCIGFGGGPVLAKSVVFTISKLLLISFLFI